MNDDETVNVEARRGFFPVVRGNQVWLTQAGAGLCVSQGDVEITQGGVRTALTRGDLSLREGGGFVLAAGGNATVAEGGAMLLAAGGNASISEGGAMLAAGRNIRLERSFVGVALAARTEVGDDSTVLIGTRQAAVIGLAAGIVCALAGRLLGGRAGG